jgi:hypothetical protein
MHNVHVKLPDSQMQFELGNVGKCPDAFDEAPTGVCVDIMMGAIKY